MLKEYTQEHSKIEYVGPGLCVPWWGVNFVQNMGTSLYVNPRGLTVFQILFWTEA